MTSGTKKKHFFLLIPTFAIGRLIYRTGWLVERFFLLLLRITVWPLFCFIRKCTPKNIYHAISALGEWVLRSVKRLCRGVTCLLVWTAHSIVADFCYWAPVFCLLAISGTFLFSQRYTIALEVSVSGKVVSYVHNEQEFDYSVSQVESKLAKTLGENYCMYTAPEYSFVLIRRNKMADEENLYAQAYQAVTEEIGNHYGLYVDGKLVAAAEEKSTLESVLEDLKAPYQTGEEDERVEFLRKVEIRTGLFAPSAMKTADQLRLLFEQSADPQYYNIEEGDFLRDIVEKTGLSEKMLYKLNPGLDDSKLVPGKKLLISQPDVYLGIKVVRTVTYEESIPYETTRVADSTLYANQTKVKTAGETGSKTVTADVTYVDGQKTETDIISSEINQKPVTRELYVGTRPYPSTYSALAGTGAFIRPISGGYTSCGFKGYAGHTGVDLTLHGAYGKPVYASAGGRVIAASYSGSYGNLIKIQHSNGYITYYAHLSAINVKTGETVVQGQQIGKIGSTGNSTGPHLHFELRINGTPVDPINYIS